MLVNHRTNDLGSTMLATVGRKPKLRKKKGPFSSGRLEATCVLQATINSL